MRYINPRFTYLLTYLLTYFCTDYIAVSTGYPLVQLLENYSSPMCDNRRQTVRRTECWRREQMPLARSGFVVIAQCFYEYCSENYWDASPPCIKTNRTPFTSLRIRTLYTVPLPSWRCDCEVNGNSEFSWIHKVEQITIWPAWQKPFSVRVRTEITDQCQCRRHSATLAFLTYFLIWRRL